MNANRVVQRQGLGGFAIWRAWIAHLFGVVMLLAAGVAAAQAPNSIEQVAVTRGAAGFTVVRFTMKAPPANPPAGFAITSPPRIALDFIDTSSALPNNQRAVDDPALRSLQFVQAGNRTRVVFNLNKPQSFDTKVEGNAVVVTLADSSPSAQSGPVAAPVLQRFAEARSTDQQHSLRDVDFERVRQLRLHRLTQLRDMPGAVAAFFYADANGIHGQAVFIHFKKGGRMRPVDTHPVRFFIDRFVIRHFHDEPAVCRGLYAYFFTEPGPCSEIG